jgi:hypothetical protein
MKKALLILSVAFYALANVFFTIGIINWPDGVKLLVFSMATLGFAITEAIYDQRHNRNF